MARIRSGKKKKADESEQKKTSIMARVFSVDDEICILKAWAALRDKGIESYNDLHQLVNTKISQVVDRDQVKHKVQKLKKKYIQAELKFRKSGRDAALFPNTKLQEVYQLSRTIWINHVPSTTSVAAHAAAAAAADGDAKLLAYIEKLKGMGLYDLLKPKSLKSLSPQQLLFELTAFSNQLQEARDGTLKMIASLEP